MRQMPRGHVTPFPILVETLIRSAEWRNPVVARMLRSAVAEYNRKLGRRPAGEA